MGIAILFLAVKGTGSSATYADASAIVEPTQNSLFALNSVVGRGLEPTPTQRISLTTIQDNTVMPHNQVLAVLFEEGTDSRTDTSIYEVQPGDVLSGIAEDFGLSTQTLITANNLKNINSLTPGLELKIPPVDGILYKVKSGDTVGSLSKKYQADGAKIISFNDLPATGDLRIGDEIIIPDGVAPKQATAVATKNVSNLRYSTLPKIDGYFMNPASCIITQKAHVRNGWDCAAKVGTPIYAAAAGTVDLVQYSNKGYGNMVRISHPNGTKTLYGHFSKIYVKQGQTVTQGQPIGEMGSTGKSTGSHVHFEVHGAQNPLSRYGMKAKVTAGI